MKVIITGATGMVGRGVLLECLDHKAIDEVLAIGRNSLEMDHPKLKEMIHKDFSDFSVVTTQLKGYDACYACMGVSVAGLSEEEYTKLTYGFTIALAKATHFANPNMTFIYVSGQGTDSTEKGRVMWARVKGKTENEILNMEFKQAFMFRPGGIIPLRGIKSRTKLYQFIYDYFLWLLKLMKAINPKSIVNTTQIGVAMINASVNGYGQRIIRPRDILRLSK